jgi:hypothetical protein
MTVLKKPWSGGVLAYWGNGKTRSLNLGNLFLEVLARLYSITLALKFNHGG